MVTLINTKKLAIVIESDDYSKELLRKILLTITIISLILLIFMSVTT